MSDIEQPHQAAAELNEQIRRLWSTGALTADGEAAYQQLLVEWAEAMRAEQELAA
ncbi:hypothetical protein ABZ958_03610 [Streptomyces sp. NPDC046237]|uniref:hypothetical protein n=1 Tax=Streptomyces sp. NPDC046237 TaxID=3154914 RepID=UPI0033C9ED59